MEKIKKHAALPALAAALAILVIFALGTYRLKDNGRFELVDISGDREAIRDVAITGELMDGIHRTRFRVENGRIRTDTKLFDQPKWVDIYRYVIGSFVRIGQMDYSVDITSSMHRVTSRRMTDKGFTVPEGTTEVTPTVVYRKPEGEGNGIKLANQPEYGLAKVGDRVYYTIPVTTEYTGTSAIYELKFYDWGFRPADEMAKYKPRELVDIPLDANESGEGPGIEILGLEAVGDRLALVSVENRSLRIRSYDSGSGQLLGETVVPEVYLPARKRDARPEGGVSYYEGYEAYSDPERMMLTLSFRRGSSEATRTDSTVLGFDFSSGVDLVDRSDVSFADGEEDTYGGVSYLGYRNGKLIAIKSYRGSETEQPRVMYDILRPKHLYLYAFENSKLIYKGEIATDMNEDNIQGYNRPPSYGGFGYSQMDYRTFVNVALE